MLYLDELQNRYSKNELTMFTVINDEIVEVVLNHGTHYPHIDKKNQIYHLVLCRKVSNLKATPIFVCQRRLYADYRSAKIAKKNMRKTYSQNLLNLAKASTDSTNLRFVTDYLINAANECKRHTGSLGMDPDLYNTLIFLRDKSTIND